MLADSEADDSCEHVVVTFARRVHVLRTLEVDRDLFLFCASQLTFANVGFVRYSLERAERHIAGVAVDVPADAIVSPDVERADRLPPGQTITRKWPVLHFGDTPAFDRATWTLRLFGLVECERELDYDDCRESRWWQTSTARRGGRDSIIFGKVSARGT